jgi:D-alanyl-D-alanine carboxypeptidase
MILDTEIETPSDGNISIDTSGGFTINPARMESFDYFDGFNTVVVGDATTGEIFYGYDYEQPYPIASTTKLMTYLLTMDAAASGKISLEDKVVISQKAADLSATSDGFVALSAGWEVPVSELILGALLPSSNECALALAEYVGGSEEKFVEMMNEKAASLGLKTAVFRNPNGLPIYSETVIPAKTQNKMSGYDMFRMCAHILNTYPQIKEITSLKTAKMETLNKDLKNTNGLLYNIPEVNGLKTGTTDKSGACLITSLTVQADDGPHDLVVVALGAENSQARIQVSELMARYGMKVLKGEAARISYSVSDESDDEEEEITSEYIVRLVVDHALKK